ncbi:MAG: M13 family metallopeptidase [Christensenellaceae bacterium]
MKKTGIITISIILAACMLFSACGVSPSAASPTTAPQSEATPKQPSATSTQEVDKKWINADLAGSVTADMSVSPKDDYTVAINQEWFSTTKIPDGQMKINSVSQIEDEMKSQILSLIADTSQTSHEAKLVQKFYHDYMDMETRNKRGVEPIMSQIKGIREISSIEELTAYYTTDSKHKMSTPPVFFAVAPDMKDSEHYAIQIQAPDSSLGDAGEYRTLTQSGEANKKAITLVFTTMLERVGYSKEEAATIKDQLFAMEGKVQAKSASISEQYAMDFVPTTYHPVSLAELKEQNKVFPVVTFLKPYTDLGVDRFINTEPEWLASMNELYTEENLEGFKAMMLYSVIDNSLLYLDQEALDLNDQKQSIATGTETKSSIEDLAYARTDAYLDMAVGKMYVENFVSPQTKTDVIKMTQEIMAVYRNRLSNNDWMSDATKEKAIEKLDSLRLKIAYPDDWTPYAYTKLNFDEENSILDDVIAIDAYEREKTIKNAASVRNKDLWTSAPQTANASYAPAENTIEIYAGILAGGYYNKDNPTAANMGGIGMVISHEITHAFDPRGGKYDKDGNLNNWWTQEDQAVFDKRTAKVSNYFSQFEVVPGVFVNGEMTLGESVADLGAMSCMLEIAKDIKGFDYDTFFKSYANVEKKQILPMAAERAMTMDPHPPEYLRANITVQQFPEFYDTVGVKEGDGMYLAPEERLAVW